MSDKLEETDDYVATAVIKSLVEDFTIYWNEFSGLTGDSKAVADIINLLDEALDANGGVQISVTPEGPFLAGDEYDAASVAWAINFLYKSEVDVRGDLPSMKDLGLDYSSNFDEDGNELIR